MTEVKYIEVATQLKQDITNGKYRVGEVIPSEKMLQEVFGVSRHTIRHAISVLVSEGYLRSEKGSGTYVEQRAFLNGEKAVNTKTIGVITTYLSDYIFPPIIRGIEETLASKGYSLLLASTNNDAALEKRSLEMMFEREVDGLIIEPTKSSFLNTNIGYYLKMQEMHLPFVMINATYEELDAPVIRMDDVQAGYLATKHLLELGHRDLSIIVKTDDMQGKYRMKGFIKALGEKDVSFDSTHVLDYTTETSEESLNERVALILGAETPPTAFLCYNDQVAMNLVEELQNLHYKIPEDFSIVSHDDSYLSTATPVKLTSVAHPKEKMGQDAANWIIKCLEKTNFEEQNILYAPQIILRNSTRKH